MNPARDPDATDRDAADLDDDFGFAEPATDQSFENALAKARDGDRLSIDDATELLATGTDTEGSTPSAKSGSSNSPTAGAMRRSATRSRSSPTSTTTSRPPATRAVCSATSRTRRTPSRPTATPTTLASRRRPPSPARSSKTPSTWASTRCARCPGSTRARAERGAPRDPSILRRPGKRGELQTARGVRHGSGHLRRADRGDVGRRDPPALDDARGGVPRPPAAPTGTTRRSTANSLRPDSTPLPAPPREILVDEVRDVICPGKIRTDDWVAAMEGAMAAGLDVTSTMMYGHVETVEHRAKHLGVIRDLQDRTGRITEFVPSPLSTRTRPSTATALSTPAPLTTRTNSWWRSRASSWTTSITCRPRG